MIYRELPGTWAYTRTAQVWERCHHCRAEPVITIVVSIPTHEFGDISIPLCETHSSRKDDQ